MLLGAAVALPLIALAIWAFKKFANPARGSLK
jgi:hypothetical protein